MTHAPSAGASGASANVGTELQFGPFEKHTRFQKPRLPREDYLGRRTYHITLATAQRAPLFEDWVVGQRFEGLLHDAATRLGFKLLASCFMPDHLHVLLRGETPASDLLKFVQLAVARYIFDNPSTAELPLGHAAYALCGGEFLAPEDEVHSDFSTAGGASSLQPDSRSDGAKASSLHSDSQARLWAMRAETEIDHDQPA